MKRRLRALLLVGAALACGLAFGLARRDDGNWKAAAGDQSHGTGTGERRIDINTAPAHVLHKLPGMSLEVVDRIVQHRPYKKLDELITRKILGRKQFARIKDQIRIGGHAGGNAWQGFQSDARQWPE